MREGKGASIMDYFETLEDPRIDRRQRRQLLDIMAIAICAVICGADSWVYIELFGKSKLAWFQTFLELPHGIPSHDTFGDVCSRLDPEQFQQCCMAWTQAVSDLVPREVVSIDGKTVRRSHDRNAGQRAIHLVSAWASANTLTLGQVKTTEKSNEITAIPQLLPMLELKGCIVTIDAMGCQQEIAQGILDRGAGYVLALKENQGQLYEDVRDRFEGAAEFGFGECPMTTHHPEPRPRTDRTSGVLDNQRPSLPGVPEHRAGLARPALGGQGGGPPGDAGRDHGAAPVLHQEPGCPGGATAEGGAHSLEHRELLALEPGCDFRGRPLPDPQGPRSAEHGHAAAGFAQSAQERNEPEGGHPGETPPGRLEGGLPAKSPTQLKRDCPDRRRRQYWGWGPPVLAGFQPCNQLFTIY